MLPTKDPPHTPLCSPRKTPPHQEESPPQKDCDHPSSPVPQVLPSPQSTLMGTGGSPNHPLRTQAHPMHTCTRPHPTPTLDHYLCSGLPPPVMPRKVSSVPPFPCEQSCLGALHDSLHSLPSRSVRYPARHRIPLPPHSPSLGSPPPCAPHANNCPIPIAPHWNLLPAQGTCTGCTPPPSHHPDSSLHHGDPSCTHEATPCTITGHRTMPRALVQHHAHPQKHSLVRRLPSLSMPARALCK
jgi:hypothetical protein